MVVENKNQKFRNHLKKHKITYITGGLCLFLGGVGTALVMNQGNSVSDIGSKINMVGYFKDTNATIVNLVERSTPSKPVHLVGTKLYFDSIRDAARQLDLDPSRISKQLSGQVADVKGHVFELLENAA